MTNKNGNSTVANGSLGMKSPKLRLKKLDIRIGMDSSESRKGKDAEKIITNSAFFPPLPNQTDGGLYTAAVQKEISVLINLAKSVPNLRPLKDSWFPHVPSLTHFLQPLFFL
jgi:hypothetical protein